MKAKLWLLVVGSVLSGAVAVAASYVGPGDIKPFDMWWGFRAYSAAYATAGGPCATIRRGSDSSTLTINATASGACDASGIAAFAGTDAVCTGSISGGAVGLPPKWATLTITSCSSGAIHWGDQIFAPQYPLPLYVTCTAIEPLDCNTGYTGTGGAGTYQVNTNEALPTATITFQVPLFAATLNDQTGNGHDLVQVDTTKQPLVLYPCRENRPCTSTQSGDWYLGASSFTTIHNPFSISAVALNYPFAASFTPVIGTGGQTFLAFDNNATFQAACEGGGVVINAPQAENEPHSLLCVLNGAFSVLYVDGTYISGTTGTANLTAPHWQSNFIANIACCGQNYEGGIIESAVNSTEAAQLLSNQSAFWGTPW